MQATVTSAAATQGNAHAEPMKFSKRIGSTTFVVAVHSSRTSKEAVQDKIIRLIESEVRNSA
jgi:hypothetical protein